MKFTRKWCFPNSDTLKMTPARELVLKYLFTGAVSIDPFAKDCELATFTNDLNPKSKAQYHLDALDFLNEMNKKTKADVVIFDPPYSRNQAKREYESFGKQFKMSDAQRTWHEERFIINKILKVGGRVISFGWNSSGMGITMLYEIEEIVLLCHGEPHYDTIIVVETKICHQENLFDQGEL